MNYADDNDNDDVDDTDDVDDNENDFHHKHYGQQIVFVTDGLSCTVSYTPRGPCFSKKDLKHTKASWNAQ